MDGIFCGGRCRVNDHFFYLVNIFHSYKGMYMTEYKELIDHVGIWIIATICWIRATDYFVWALKKELE